MHAFETGYAPEPIGVAMRRLCSGTLALKRLSRDDTGGVERFGAKYSLPNLAGFLAHLERLQEGDEEACGRRYQRDAIRSGALTLVSPVSANVITSHDSVPIVWGGVGYRFRDAFEFFVLALQIRMGYPLAGLYLPDHNCLATWGATRPIKADDAQHIVDTLRLARAAERRAGPASSVSIVIGHHNFAHHMWNELPALDSLLRAGGFDRPPIVLARRQTLGPLTRIFPEMRGWTVAPTPDDACRDAGRGLVVNVAGTRLSCELRERLVRTAWASAGADTASLVGRMRRSGAPVFWLSVRTQPPTLTNQTDVLVVIARRLLQKFDKCWIVFDGFSLPEDWDSVHDMRAFYAASATEAKAAIERVLDALKGACRSSGQMLVNAGGLRVLDSIALAQAASTYFCHVGTIQHKIGWTTCAPGMIHGNRRILATGPAVRHTDLADGAVAPAAIDPEWIEDEDGRGKQVNYRALDVERFAGQVADRLGDYVLRRNCRYAG